jgi:hypothetical protein
LHLKTLLEFTFAHLTQKLKKYNIYLDLWPLVELPEQHHFVLFTLLISPVLDWLLMSEKKTDNSMV